MAVLFHALHSLTSLFKLQIAIVHFLVDGSYLHLSIQCTVKHGQKLIHKQQYIKSYE